MVATVKRATQLGMRSGMVTATAGLMIAYLIFFGVDENPLRVLQEAVNEFSFSSSSRARAVLLAVLAVYLSAWFYGGFVGKQVLYMGRPAFVWSLMSGLVDLFFGVLVYLLSGLGTMDVGVLDFVAMLLSSMLIAGVVAILPIAIVSMLRGLWLKRAVKKPKPAR